LIALFAVISLPTKQERATTTLMLQWLAIVEAIQKKLKQHKKKK
jgi:hypothetical protein